MMFSMFRWLLLEFFTVLISIVLQSQEASLFDEILADYQNLC